MTNVKSNGVPFERSFSSFFDNLLSDVSGISKADTKRPGLRTYVPVNIFETDAAYLLDVVAPGFEKTDFSINLDKNILTIAAESKAEESLGNQKNLRKEFFQRSFKRTFTVDNTIDTEKIEAKYVNGILKIVLSKKEKEKTASKDITIQ
ncbi:MAG: Hsp20/alpha crystallin family protein [Niabella sp.]